MTAAGSTVTASELEVIRALAAGRTVGAIARELGVSANAITERVASVGQRLGTTGTIRILLACERRGLLGGRTHRAEAIRREIADRHTTTCALLTPRVCNCGADPETATQNGAT